MQFVTISFRQVFDYTRGLYADQRLLTAVNLPLKAFLPPMMHTSNIFPTEPFIVLVNFYCPPAASLSFLKRVKMVFGSQESSVNKTPSRWEVRWSKKI